MGHITDLQLSDITYTYVANSNTYAYDAADNPTQLDGNTGYAYDNANQLSTAPGTAYTYDQLDERTSTSTGGATQAAYSYDQAGRLISYTAANGTATTYAYNGDGLRVTKTTGGITSTFAWDNTATVPLALSDGQHSYIYGPDNVPIEQMDESGTPLYLHQDQLGSTRMITDQNGAISATFTYSPYGTQTGTTGSATTALGYAGQYADPESGLTYMRARYYDPATAQFLTRDALEVLTRQPYGYANDNPVTYTDPSGQLFGIPDPFTPLASAIGGAVGAVSGAVGYGAGVISGNQSLSLRGAVGAVAGGAVGGAVTGACVEATDALGLAVCGAAAGAASTVVNNAITGQNLTSGLGIGIALGAVANVVAGQLFPTRGMLPENMSNLWNPGINAQRLYAQAGLAGLVNAFGTAAEATPAYADSFATAGLCGAL
jgi:RHS repeat-associated protein